MLVMSGVGQPPAHINMTDSTAEPSPSINTTERLLYDSLPTWEWEEDDKNWKDDPDFEEVDANASPEEELDLDFLIATEPDPERRRFLQEVHTWVEDTLDVIEEREKALGDNEATVMHLKLFGTVSSASFRLLLVSDQHSDHAQVWIDEDMTHLRCSDREYVTVDDHRVSDSFSL